MLRIFPPPKKKNPKEGKNVALACKAQAEFSFFLEIKAGKFQSQRKHSVGAQTLDSNQTVDTFQHKRVCKPFMDSSHLKLLPTNIFKTIWKPTSELICLTIATKIYRK